MESGLQGVTAHRPNTKVFAAALTYRVGLFDDPPGSAGLSHFAEHVAFHGRANKAASDIGAVGGYVNAFTSSDHTEFQAFGHIEQLTELLEFLVHILSNAPAESDQVRAEHLIFFHELSGRRPTKRQSAQRHFHCRINGDPNWRHDHANLSWRRVTRFNADQVNAFRSKYYTISNARLALVTPLAHDELHLRLAERFGMLAKPASDSQVGSRTPVESPRFKLYLDSHSYAWLDIVQKFDKTDPVTRISADIMARVLGGGPSSKMYQHLRVNRRLTYDGRASHHNWLSHTTVNCFCSIASRSANETLEYMASLLDGIVEQGITAEEFESEKVRLRRWHELSLENPLGLVSYLAYAAHRPCAEASLHSNAYLNTLNALTLSALNESAAELLSSKNRHIFLAGRLNIFARFALRRRLRAATGG